MAPQIAIIGGGPSGLTLARLLECNNIDYVVYERNISENSHPGQGGSLDIHGATGQEAPKRGGLSAEFEKLARRDATVAQVADKTGKQLVKFVGQAVKNVEGNFEGNVVTHFADGSKATGFRLVVGADGAWSKVRHLLTSAQPKYSGKSYIEGKISPANPFYPQVEARVGHGSMLAFGSRKHLAVQQMSDGSYRIYLGLTVSENAFALDNPNVDLVADNGALAREFFLSRPDYFSDWDDELKGIMANSEGGFRYWPLYHMAPNSLSWEHAPQVTLIGDAAHVSTPFVGEGVNCAMYDSLVLLEKILEFGTGDNVDRAIAEYEKDMFKRGRDLIERSMGSAELLFADDAPSGLVQIIQGSSE
ncbi:hypothetical protein CDV31_015442 [Fusarium ambrosium]|uniref:FAD-binding domain-containing protein n=1 Tax=Fusarium ambrosium TaxID=131363 RepID=A0A428SP10_9HYPO|nr:hypothetical protein CDV31_015442 [Fusarium ambrosium]